MGKIVLVLNERSVGDGKAGGPMTPPDFDRSVNLITTKGDAHHITTCPPPHTRVLKPSYGPA